MNTQELVQNVENRVRNSTVSDIDDFRSRECESESYSGVSVTITGNHVSVDPIFEVIKNMENWRVQNIGMHGDISSDDEDQDYERGVVMFFAYVGHVLEDDIFVD